LPAQETTVKVQQVVVVTFDVDKVEEDGDDDADDQGDQDDHLLVFRVRASKQTSQRES
jgi:hypothetical protein